MPNCQSCGAYIHSDGWCIKCGVKALKERKKEKTSRFGKKKSDSELDKAIKKADKLFSEKLRAKYDNGGFTNCSTCSKPIRTFGGTFGAHCGHLFPKFRYWLHRWDFRNAAPQCYDCNVNHEGHQIKMYDWLSSRHGSETMAALREEIELFDVKVKSGMAKKKPDLVFINSEIEKIKLWKI
jgi:hypothetical protein